MQWRKAKQGQKQIAAWQKQIAAWQKKGQRWAQFRPKAENRG